MKKAPMPGQLAFDFDTNDSDGRGVDEADVKAEVEATAPLGASALLRKLHEWSEAGWLRRLDSALAAFIATLSPSASSAVLLATALLSNLEGQGHSCLSLDDLVDSAGASMEWPELAAIALAEAMRKLPPGAAAWGDALRACDAVGWANRPVDGASGGKPPLVLDGDLLYLRRYWRYETTIARQALARVGVLEAVDPAPIRHWLDRLFPASPARPGVDWQKASCAIALRGRLSIITGGPGTGKTHTAARVLALAFALSAEPQRLRVALAAPTGKAAARLKDSIGAALSKLQPLFDGQAALQDLAGRIPEAQTLHRLLGARPDTRTFRYHTANPLDIDLLIVDEASMVHLEMAAALLDALPSHARVVLLGDKDQLASVEAGSVLGDLCAGAEGHPYDQGTREFLETAVGGDVQGGHRSGSPLAQQTVMLRESRRFAGPIGALALAVNAGDAAGAAALLRDPTQRALNWSNGAHGGSTVTHEVLRLALGTDLSGGYRRYCELLKERPPPGSDHEAWVRRVLAGYESFRVLCAVREGDGGVLLLNTAIERALGTAGLLTRNGEWYEGRPVMVTRNDPAAGVCNGDVGVALRPPERGGALRVHFASGASVRSVLTTRLGHVETAFAMTVHKSQGSEFEHTVLVLSSAGQRSSRELVYTGITRAREVFSLVAAEPDALVGPLVRKTRRGSGLARIIAESSIRREGGNVVASPRE